MAEFWGKKKEDFTAVVENDCNQTINIKKKKDENYENKEFIGFCDESVIFEAGEHICIKCRFVTKNLKDFKRHLNTKKHKKKPQKKPQPINEKKYLCLCGKSYKFQSGLSKHCRKCEKYIKKIVDQKTSKKMEKNAIFGDIFLQKNAKNEKYYANNFNYNENGDETMYGNTVNKQSVFEKHISSESISVTKSELEKIIEQTFTQNNNITKLLEQNAVLIEKMGTMKMANNISYQNCGNKKMTINFYLNEKCKDAMNLSDFVSNLDISLEDLLYTQEHGYAEGISNIFVKHLQNLNPYKRPIHCCNKKNMQFYVRDENKWQKDKENKKIDRSIQDLTVKQIKHLKEWEIQNPNYLQDDNLLTQWQQLVHEIMGPSNDSNKEKNKELIIKKLGKTVNIKENLVIKDGDKYIKI
jgi:hypothetical protein